MSLHFSSVLRPAQIDLRMRATSQQEAVTDLLALLRTDERVTDFARLEQAVITRNAPALCENGIGLCIAHGRSDCLQSLVMAAGRLENPFPLCGEFGAKSNLRLVFVAGIPSSLSSEYLRLVGAIARICSQQEGIDLLLEATTPQSFLDVLENGLNPL